MKISFFRTVVSQVPMRSHRAGHDPPLVPERSASKVPASEARWRVLSRLTDISEAAVPHWIPARVMQPSTQVDLTENRDRTGNRSDRILGSARILGVESGTYRMVCFFMLSCLIFKSSVDRGIPSFEAAPFGPATFPLLSTRAASMSSFS